MHFSKLFPILFIVMINISAGKLYADDYFGQKFSTAGFYSLPNTGREVWNMNPAWRFYKGDISGAELPDFDDSSWEQVSLPHGIELLPTEASGCINYQGPVWYRKKMSLDKNLSGKRITLYFEGIMGKSELWVNGKYFARHLGGYLPWVIDITNVIKAGEINVIAVRADNSDDPSYPPGKPQRTLDFTYAGGIYRDCWLIAHNDVYITDANAAGIQAGGGLFVSYDTVSEKSATLRLDLGLHNSRTSSFRGKIRYELYAPNGKYVADIEQGVSIGKKGIKQSVSKLTVVNPLLWTPDSPYLYTLKVFVKDSKSRIIDGYATRIGIRTFEFKGKDGFWLNGKPYPEPLVGANRHQDFAVIGNALPNSLHWRDAKKLRDAGLKVIRSAHYPQDPAFMDACDELGLFVIVPTPGWQFWNNDPLFELRVYNDIRQMVRRDRNHPSVWLWEPILNETWYPEDFAKNTLDIIHSEYPFSPCYAACDASAKGHELFPVQYTHPSMGGGGVFNAEKLEPNVSYFTREWGDNVDDWFSHNSPSRVYRGWGEIPMLQQAQGYARPNFRYTCYDLFYTLPRQHVGGCLWHPFDHQRGYHPDPFYGGIMDAFRQPKLSYYMFCSQRPNQTNPGST